jgi:serine/threonine protein kinase HipA of HipAB toxin-antitoxin module
MSTNAESSLSDLELLAEYEVIAAAEIVVAEAEARYLAGVTELDEIMAQEVEVKERIERLPQMKKPGTADLLAAYD